MLVGLGGLTNNDDDGNGRTDRIEKTLFSNSKDHKTSTEKKVLLNQKHFFPKACIVLIHKNIIQEPINMLLIL